MTNPQNDNYKKYLGNKTNNTNEKKEVKAMKTTENKEITDVRQITNEYIDNFYMTASQEQRDKIKQFLAEAIDEKGEFKYFTTYRMKFASEFMPQLVEKKAKRGGNAQLSKFEEMDKLIAGGKK
jgi:hypothetical protein